MLKAEWQSIWKDKKLLLSIVVMFIMPVLYAGMLLWAFWDPYGRIDKLPVALVNEDVGTEFEGETLAVGDELVHNLLESETFQFVEVPADEVEQGLLNQEYYLYIHIPKNFSQHATTLLDEHPEKLEIEYKANEGYNFLSSKIGDSAINAIRAEVNEQVSKTYAEQLFVAINKLGDGYKEAADGASKIEGGALDLANGTEDLKGYLAQLASSTVTLSDGTEKLYNGVVTASNGAQSLVDGSQSLAGGASKLSQGAATLEVGAENLKGGISSYTKGVAALENGQLQVVEKQAKITAGASQMAEEVTTLQSSLRQVQTGATRLATNAETIKGQLQEIMPNLPAEQQQALQAAMAELGASSQQLANSAGAVANGSGALAAGANQLAEGSTAIAGGQQQVLTGIQQLNANSQALNSGAEQLAQGSATIQQNVAALATGAQQLANGTEKLSSGLSEVVAGSASLNEGTSQLSSKSSELAQGSTILANGAAQLVNGTEKLKTSLASAGDEAAISVNESTYDMVASPVEVDKEIKFETPNYGTGLAPYFIALGLFVGALLLTNVYPFVQPAKHPTSIIGWFMSKSAVPFVVWIFQVGIIVSILTAGLGLKTTNLSLFILTVAIVSFSSLAIVQMLTVLFNDVGRFLSLIFLIVQLATSAGTFPIELIPDKLQWLHDFMPMTYAVRAFRAVISSGDTELLTSCLTILSIIGIVCVAISFGFFALLFKRRYSRKVETAEL